MFSRYSSLNQVLASVIGRDLVFGDGRNTVVTDSEGRETRVEVRGPKWR